jgi:hypothetical protein
MKEMKCPECEEASTFTHEWTGTFRCSAPVSIFGNEVEIDYEADDCDDNCDCECRCDKCGTRLALDEIEVVNEVDAEMPAK